MITAKVPPLWPPPSPAADDAGAPAAGVPPSLFEQPLSTSAPSAAAVINRVTRIMETSRAVPWDGSAAFQVCNLT
ncbi:hypothetical protein GCM10022226_81180 [Sphaerisporangium flaviroseum]|uniref:Uncharacterized protein n=1 Tax=Sphaerisporangium flaviroseum TaxID=509199 RepID=A0ABP7JI81_9ACTN